jgi:molybdenum cofactor biosynthesis protein B
MTEKHRVATVTASDTRTPSDDVGGALLRELLGEAGFELGPHEIVREDLSELRARIGALAEADGVRAVVVTGGTGVGPRDQTIEAIMPLLDKVLDGFGEAFRRLSWDEVGPRSILSRAVAGTHAGRVIVALPGSPAAVRLGVRELIAPTLGHAIGLASGKHGHHHRGGG